MSEETVVTTKDGSTGDNGSKAIVEKQKRSPVSLNPNPPKKPRTGCWGDPDVIVVVGGQEFQEHSSHLCSWSGYFHAALTREWKESKTKRFEFPHRNPEEWEILTSILAQFATTKISKDNYRIVLSWCDELIIPNAMAECDRFLVGFVDPFLQEKTFGELLDVLKVTLEPSNSLPLTRAKCIQLIAGRAYSWNNDELKTILEFAEEHEDCGEKFRGVLNDVLPSCCSFPFFYTAQERKDIMEEKFCRVFLVLPIAVEHGLKTAKDTCIELLKVALKQYSHLLTMEHLQIIGKEMADNEELCEELWRILGLDPEVGLIPKEEKRGSAWLALIHQSLGRKIEKEAAEKREKDLKKNLENCESELKMFREKMDQVAAIIKDFSGRKTVSSLLAYLEAKEVPLYFNPWEKEWQWWQ